MLLSELFAEFPTTPINIDTKSGDTKMLEKISALVKGSASPQILFLRIIWFGVSKVSLHYCRHFELTSAKFGRRSCVLASL